VVVRQAAPPYTVTVSGAQDEEVPEARGSLEAAARISGDSTVVAQIRNAGFEAPTLLQAHTWAIACSARDFISVASDEWKSKSEFGHFSDFLLPGFARVLSEQATDPSHADPKMLVVTMTQELAVQITQEAEQLGGSLDIHSTCCSGGIGRGPPLSPPQSGAQVVVANLRSLDLCLAEGQVRLGNCFYVVLDEVDRMLELGYEPHIRRIFQRLPTSQQGRQALFYARYRCREMESLARDLLVRPLRIQVAAAPAAAAPPPGPA
jgi:superfamily II DNA/RNA helicase